MVTLPLILLAIPSVVIGWPGIGPLLFGDYFQGAIVVAPAHDVLGHLGREFHGPAAFVLHGFTGPAVWLAAAGVLAAWFLYLKRPALAARAAREGGRALHAAREQVLLRLVQRERHRGRQPQLGMALWKGGDVAVIDGAAVNGRRALVGVGGPGSPAACSPATSITTLSR